MLAFANLLEMWKRAGEEAKKEGKPDMVHLEENIDFFHEYSQMVNQSYNKKWLRPGRVAPQSWSGLQPPPMLVGKESLAPEHGRREQGSLC